mgnify:CR=1 FL=1
MVKYCSYFVMTSEKQMKAYLARYKKLKAASTKSIRAKKEFLDYDKSLKQKGILIWGY